MQSPALTGLFLANYEIAWHNRWWNALTDASGSLKQFNRPVKTTGHNCLNHSLKAEVTVWKKAVSLLAARLWGWTCGAGPCRVEITLKVQWSAKDTARCFVTVTWSFVFLCLFVVGPCHCHANDSHTVKLATICGKLFRRLLIYYCTYIYKFISLTYSFCLPFVAKGILDGTPSPLKCPNCNHMSPFIPCRSMKPTLPNYHLWFWQIYTFSKSCFVRWAMVTWYFPILMLH